MSRSKYKKMKKAGISTPVIILLLIAAFFIYKNAETDTTQATHPPYSDTVANVEAYSGSPYVVINEGQPEFTEADHTTIAYESYSELDHLGRCGVAMACVGKELMPTQDREDIGSVKPSGWNNKPYDFVDGEYLYNRCHLIGFQLTGENANARNLITGTRYMNTQGMLPFENMIADYVKETGNHVLYRVTPIFEGEELVARGVQMEARSVEDQGDGICFNVYAYNVQPGVTICYSNGDNWEQKSSEGTEVTYILNTSSGKFHTSDCSQAGEISEHNKKTMKATRQFMSECGYVAAGCCNP